MISFERAEPSKLTKIVLFGSIFLLLILLSKRMFNYYIVSCDELNFVLKSVATFVCAQTLTGAILKWLPEHTVKISMLSILGIIILLR